MAYLGIEASKNLYNQKVGKEKKEVDWSNPYEVMEKHKSISEGQRMQCFFAMNVNKKEMPGFLMISHNIHIAPPLFGVSETKDEPKYYMEQKFLHSREEPQIMDGQIVEHTDIFKKVTEYLNSKWPNNYIFYNLSKKAA